MIQFSAGSTYPIIVSEPGKTLTLTNVTLTDSAGTVTAETVTGQTLVIAVPSNTALGAATINYDVNDGSGAVAATPIAVTVVAPPSAPVPGAQLVLVGGKYQLMQPNGVTFGASPTLTLTDANSNIVFGPTQVDVGSATDLPTWTLTGVAVGVYTATVNGLISGSSQTLTETVQVALTLGARWSNVTLTGTVSGPDGNPAAEGTSIIVGLTSSVIPHDPSMDAVDAQLLASSAAPVTFAFNTPPSGLPEAAWRKTVAAAGGSFELTVPTPSAMAYARGARTDADMDRSRGGRFNVEAWAMIGNSAPISFAIDESAIAEDGTLDISAALTAPPAF